MDSNAETVYHEEEIFKWSPADIRCLISLVAKKNQKFEVMQKNKIWREIAAEISEMQGKEISAERCCGKWKGFKTNYKRIKLNGGHNTKNWEYYDSMDAILGNKPEYCRLQRNNSNELNVDTTFYHDESTTATQPDDLSDESFNEKNVWIETGEEEEDGDQMMEEMKEEIMTFSDDTPEDTEIYGKGWAAQYRLLTPAQKLYAKRVIDEALFLGRIAKLTNQTATKLSATCNNQASAIKRIIPMLDRILVQRAEALTTTKGGIMLPEKSVGKVLQGTVVAVGPGSRNSTSGGHIPIGVKEGDRVLLPEFGGTKVEMEDKKEYILFRESDILAKLE